MTTSEEDRGLRAVGRVRAVREQDSRYGLSVALQSVHDRDAEVEAARTRLKAAEDFGTGSVTDFRGHLDRLAGLVQLERQAAERAEASRAVAAEAQRRWQHERQQVRVVDLLLARRATARALERARREQAVLDDVAVQGWSRRRPEPELVGRPARHALSAAVPVPSGHGHAPATPPEETLR